jgi:hypothetical protein
MVTLIVPDQEITDLRVTLNLEIDGLRHEFLELRSALKQQIGESCLPSKVLASVLQALQTTTSWVRVLDVLTRLATCMVFFFCGTSSFNHCSWAKESERELFALNRESLASANDSYFHFLLLCMDYVAPIGVSMACTMWCFALCNPYGSIIKP